MNPLSGINITTTTATNWDEVGLADENEGLSHHSLNVIGVTWMSSWETA
jgi:hypothetical protein